MSEPIEPPWTDADIEALRERNAQRVQRAIEALGPAWVLWKRPAQRATVALEPVNRWIDAYRRSNRA